MFKKGSKNLVIKLRSC